MVFVAVITLLGGLALLFSAIEDVSINDYIKGWVGSK